MCAFCIAQLIRRNDVGRPALIRVGADDHIDIAWTRRMAYSFCKNKDAQFIGGFVDLRHLDSHWEGKLHVVVSAFVLFDEILQIEWHVTTLEVAA